MKKQLTEHQLVVLYRSFLVLGDDACLKILYELDRFGEKTFTELKEELDINPATLSKKLKLLVEVGLLAPDRTHDHLRVFYSLNLHQKPLKRVLDAIERLAGDL